MAKSREQETKAARAATAAATRARQTAKARKTKKEVQKPSGKRSPTSLRKDVVQNLEGQIGSGRPLGTPQTWTPEYIQTVAEAMRRYIETTDVPTEARFCYDQKIHHQRLSDIPELRALRDWMFAKRQAVIVERGLMLKQGEGPLGSFYQKLMANAGPYSMVDRGESVVRKDSEFSDMSDDELNKLISEEIERRNRG